VDMKLKDNDLYHLCVFSDSILTSSVVINSTSINTKTPEKMVFHLFTDEINYAVMKSWFSLNDFRELTLEVQRFQDFSWLNALITVHC